MPIRTFPRRQRNAKLANMSDSTSNDTPESVYDLLKRLSADKDLVLQWVPGSKGTIVLAVDSEKGGVGKTAAVTGLAAVAGAHGLSVLVIDLDPRATATEELGVDNPEYSVNDILSTDDDDDPADVIGAAVDAISPSGEGWPDTVHVIAAERALGNREADLADGMDLRLKLSLQGVAEKYDLVLLDLPPRAGGKLVSTAFNAATHVLLPATLDEDGFIGARDALKSITRKNTYEPGSLTVLGVFRNIVDRRATSLGRLYDDRMRDEFGGLLIEDAAVASYIVRKEARSACIPFTAADSPEVTTLQRGYVSVLNHIWRNI